MTNTCQMRLCVYRYGNSIDAEPTACIKTNRYYLTYLFTQRYQLTTGTWIDATRFDAYVCHEHAMQIEYQQLGASPQEVAAAETALRSHEADRQLRAVLQYQIGTRAAPRKPQSKHSP